MVLGILVWENGLMSSWYSKGGSEGRFCWEGVLEGRLGILFFLCRVWDVSRKG